jgi:hypothetical protein
MPVNKAPRRFKTEVLTSKKIVISKKRSEIFHRRFSRGEKTRQLQKIPREISKRKFSPQKKPLTQKNEARTFAAGFLAGKKPDNSKKYREKFENGSSHLKKNC